MFVESNRIESNGVCVVREKKLCSYQPDLSFHTVMTHIHTPYSLSHLGIGDLALVHPVMALSENQIAHRDTALVSRQHPLVLYYVVLAKKTKSRAKSTIKEPFCFHFQILSFLFSLHSLSINR